MIRNAAARNDLRGWFLIGLDLFLDLSLDVRLDTFLVRLLLYDRVRHLVSHLGAAINQFFKSVLG